MNEWIQEDIHPKGDIGADRVHDHREEKNAAEANLLIADREDPDHDQETDAAKEKDLVTEEIERSLLDHQNETRLENLRLILKKVMLKGKRRRRMKSQRQTRLGLNSVLSLCDHKLVDSAFIYTIP